MSFANVTMIPADVTLQAIGFRVVALLIICGVHGAVVAGTAVLLGDQGPKHDGRLTIVPTNHIDVVGAAALILFGLGWPKPVAVDPGEFRMPRSGIFVVILAGFLVLAAVAALLDLLLLPTLTMLSDSVALATAAFLRIAADLLLWVALLSLVPLPPLTGGMLLTALGIRVPRQVEWILTALLLVAIATGLARQLLNPAHEVLARIIIGD